LTVADLSNCGAAAATLWPESWRHCTSSQTNAVKLQQKVSVGRGAGAQAATLPLYHGT
jgi:hypothetical protein